MRTPREVFLNRHRDETKSLDQIRTRVIATELDCDAMAEARSGSSETELDASFAWPAAIRSWLTMNRLTSSAFASAWIVIVTLNISTNLVDTEVVSAGPESDAGEVIAGLREYRSQLALLLFDEEPADSQIDPEPTDGTGPRSDADRPRKNALIRTNSFA